MSFLRNGLASFPRRFLTLAAMVALFASMGAYWHTSSAVAKPAPQAKAARALPESAAASPSSAAERDEGGEEADDKPAARGRKKAELSGKLNLNTASEEQLQLLPTVGPAKAERIVSWRKKNGSFKRVADLRKVKGFGYKTLKRLEPFLDISGETTLAEK